MLHLKALYEQKNIMFSRKILILIKFGKSYRFKYNTKFNEKNKTYQSSSSKYIESKRH